MKYMYWVFWSVEGEMQEAYFSDKQAAEFFMAALQNINIEAHMNRYTWAVDVEK